jgi:hypothetical protein
MRRESVAFCAAPARYQLPGHFQWQLPARLPQPQSQKGAQPRPEPLGGGGGGPGPNCLPVPGAARSGPKRGGGGGKTPTDTRLITQLLENRL